MKFKRAVEDFSDDELREYACEHVLYEITHFIRAVQAIEAPRAGLFPMNFAIEVFALHFRNLLDFFAPRNARKTDACARHFHKEWEEPELNLYLREARWMADKHIAHLTTDRTTDIDLKTWAVEPIVALLFPSSSASRMVPTSSAITSASVWLIALRSFRLPAIRQSFLRASISRRVDSRVRTQRSDLGKEWLIRCRYAVATARHCERAAC